MKSDLCLREWLIRWMYLMSLAHLLGGILMAWFSSTIIFDQYHQTVLTQFKLLPDIGRPIQQWWSSLFGATLQTLAFFMAILIHLGNKYRNAWVWLWMIAALIIWVPQDIFISLKVDLWLHVWIDILALIFILPPLAILFHIDRQ